MKAVVIAAGAGSRILGEANHTPKILLPFGDETILSTIAFSAKGIGLYW